MLIICIDFVENGDEPKITSFTEMFTSFCPYRYKRVYPNASTLYIWQFRLQKHKWIIHVCLSRGFSWWRQDIVFWYGLHFLILICTKSTVSVVALTCHATGQEGASQAIKLHTLPTATGFLELRTNKHTVCARNTWPLHRTQATAFSGKCNQT